jgi:hypothetical protein
MLDQETEDLKQEIAEKARKIKHLEEDLRQSIRNRYVNWDNISGCIGGGAFLIGIPIFLFLNYFGANSEGGVKMILGFFAGVVGTSIGAYLYHRSVEAEQEKRLRQLDIGSHVIEKVTH